MAPAERNDRRAAQDQPAMPRGIERGEEGGRRYRRVPRRDEGHGTRGRRGKSLVGGGEADRDIRNQGAELVSCKACAYRRAR